VTGSLVTVPAMPLDPAVAKRLAALGRKAKEGTAERDRYICEVYAAGGGLREIARAVGLSHAGVRRVLVRNGLVV
jgi:hypothetical protein